MKELKDGAESRDVERFRLRALPSNSRKGPSACLLAPHPCGVWGKPSMHPALTSALDLAVPRGTRDPRSYTQKWSYFVPPRHTTLQWAQWVSAKSRTIFFSFLRLIAAHSSREGLSREAPKKIFPQITEEKLFLDTLDKPSRLLYNWQAEEKRSPSPISRM